MTRSRLHLGARLRLELLERRDAPATLVSPTRVTYQDADGDDVSVTFSKPILNAGNVNSVFLFNPGTVNGSNTTKQQLRRIDLSALGPAASGTAITVTSLRSPVTGGDGFAAVGHINATGIDLGPVTIDGDLGRILAGDPVTATNGLKGLSVHSLGRFGTSTGAPDLTSIIEGTLSYLKVKSDVNEAGVDVRGGLDGRIVSITIGGSVIGGLASNSGWIRSSGNMGLVTIQGNLTGGEGNFTGRVHSLSNLAGMTIGGSVQGGDGANSGMVLSNGDMGFVTIKGNVIGDDGDFSGRVHSLSNLAGITIGGSVQGGLANGSGAVTSIGDMGLLTIKGSLIGGDGELSGSVSSANAAGVKIGGSVIGGSGEDSGQIESTGAMGPVRIGGSVIGGSAEDSGRVRSSGAMSFVAISGSLVGGGGTFSGTVSSGSTLAGVKIAGSLVGTGGPASGAVFASGDLGFVTIQGNLVSEGFFGTTGRVSSNTRIAGVTIGGSVLGGSINVGSEIGFVTILGSVVGNEYDGSGRIRSFKIGSVKIGGSLAGGAGIQSGMVVADVLGPVTVLGDLIGGLGEESGRIHAGEMGFVTIQKSVLGGGGHRSGTLRAEVNLAGVKIGGSLVGSSDSAVETALIWSEGDLGFVTIQGSIVGGDFGASGSIIAGGNMAGVKIAGSVHGRGDSSGRIGAGGDLGFVTIGGDLNGGTRAGSGSIVVNGNLAGVKIGGSLHGVSVPTGSPSDIAEVGSIIAYGNIGNITIGGNLVGGSMFLNTPIYRSGFIGGKRIASITLGGSFIAGFNEVGDLGFHDNGAIRAEDDIGSILIKKNIIGNETNAATIRARGSAAPTATSDVALGSLRVLGRVELAEVLAGYNSFGINADAQIGTVVVGGDWICSSIAAGASPTNGLFGDGDDVKISGAGVKDVATVSSRIASLTIGGQAMGTIGGADHFGVVAEHVGAVRIGGVTRTLAVGSGNDDFFVGITQDFKVNEL